MEIEKNGELPFLDTKIFHNQTTGQISSTWYRKDTDTGLIMNFHSMAPRKYKRSLIGGLVHRIYRACSNWELFHQSLEEAKIILEKNQYPPTFYDPIINETLTKIIKPEKPQKASGNGQTTKKALFLVQYKGKISEDFARSLHKANAPITVVFTLRKLRTALVPLKPSVDKMLKNQVVYKITCPGCNSCYIGETTHLLSTRFKEHKTRDAMFKHLMECKWAKPKDLKEEHVEIIHQTTRGEHYLTALEALYIKEQKPVINTKHNRENGKKARDLIIKL